ncbi:hypothetical protein Cme02nite_26480 [Catellatospora methionotrophica]|uniref:DUF11 domain-containing protein n=1 Tax=Catellatospora methionotrophica TaxID=121620 RepID=A0A8J3LFR7_9ACTN|nr:hypothetical protein [Catellatospora methionotrophica]GIG14316.1 hypothetical protein Cme02nite_26480 [Catellatospora methionotrophica]
MTVAFGAALGLAAGLPAAAAPAKDGLKLDLPAAAGATALGSADDVVGLTNTTGHDLSKVVLQVRLTGGLAQRVELAGADWCDHTKTTATCKVDRITPGQGFTIRLDLRARAKAPLGAAGTVSVSARGVGVPAAYGTFGVAVASPPYTDVAAVAEQAQVYLHTGDTATMGVEYRNTGPVPALLRVADPVTAGFDDMTWLDCPEDDGDACLLQLPAGQSKRLGFTMRLTGPAPAEPHVAMTVEGAYDRIVTDNLAVYPVCVYDTGRCTRHLPGTRSDVFAAPAPRAEPAPGPDAENQAVALTQPEHVPVAVERELAAEEPYSLLDEVTGILVYSLLAVLILGTSVALALRKRAADRG